MKAESSIDISLVTFNRKRWHMARSSSTNRRPSMTVGIASEYSWSQGYARWGIHIKPHNWRLEDGYKWWSSGRPFVNKQGLTTIDYSADTAAPLAESFKGWLSTLGYALLRDVREPVEPITGPEDMRLLYTRILYWRRMLLHRGATFYGRDSLQYRLLFAHAQGRMSKKLVNEDLDLDEAWPRWKHIRARMAEAGQPYQEETIMRSIHLDRHCHTPSSTPPPPPPSSSVGMDIGETNLERPLLRSLAPKGAIMRSIVLDRQRQSPSSPPPPPPSSSSSVGMDTGETNLKGSSLRSLSDRSKEQGMGAET
jgi:hypothetical protein